MSTGLRRPRSRRSAVSCRAPSTRRSSDDGAVVAYSWDFGDGGTSSAGPQVTHQYSEAGTVDVTLVVADDEGLDGSVTESINVQAEPVRRHVPVPRPVHRRHVAPRRHGAPRGRGGRPRPARVHGHRDRAHAACGVDRGRPHERCVPDHGLAEGGDGVRRRVHGPRAAERLHRVGDEDRRPAPGLLRDRCGVPVSGRHARTRARRRSTSPRRRRSSRRQLVRPLLVRQVLEHHDVDAAGRRHRQVPRVRQRWRADQRAGGRPRPAVPAGAVPTTTATTTAPAGPTASPSCSRRPGRVAPGARVAGSRHRGVTASHRRCRAVGPPRRTALPALSVEVHDLGSQIRRRRVEGQAEYWSRPSPPPSTSIPDPIGGDRHDPQPSVAFAALVLAPHVLAMIGSGLVAGPASADGALHRSVVDEEPRTNSPQVVDGRVFAITQVGDDDRDRGHASARRSPRTGRRRTTSLRRRLQLRDRGHQHVLRAEARRAGRDARRPAPSRGPSTPGGSSPTSPGSGARASSCST